MSRKIRVAGVAYLNAAPLTAPLADEPEVDLFLGPPCEVARRLGEDEADVALIPVAAAATIGDLELLDLGVASRGPVRSVVLVANDPLEEVHTLALDASSRTSVVLARLELAARRATLPKMLAMPPEEAIAAVGSPEGRVGSPAGRVRSGVGALVIGDPAIDLAPRFPFSLDLAASWRERTGLPFVFAAWAARRGKLDARTLVILRRAADRGLRDRERLARAYATKKGLAPEACISYLREAITHELGDEERAGLARFFAEASTAGWLPPAKPSMKHTAHTDPYVTYEPVGDGGDPSVDALVAGAMDGARLSAADALRIHREADLFSLGLAADAVRKRKATRDVVTYIVDRNVNYTNVCTTSCRFCAFYRPLGHEEGYVLSRDVLRQKLGEVVDAGGVQILLQGGLHPELRIEWYEDLFRWIKREFSLGLHALSPEEILHIARLESLPVRTVLERLHAAGLDSVPGGGAEILVDRVRKTIAKAKCTSDEWLSVMRTAHHLGLRSSATMMYGTVDDDADRIAHLVKLRELQDETGGFTAFFCWDFQHEKGTRIAPGEHGTVLYLRTQALARLVLDNFDHVGSSWVTQGPAVGQIALRFGADDWGSVMFEENVVSSAGTTFARDGRTDAERIERQVRGAGFRVVRRDVRYRYLGVPS